MWARQPHRSERSWHGVTCGMRAGVTWLCVSVPSWTGVMISPDGKIVMNEKCDGGIAGCATDWSVITIWHRPSGSRRDAR